MVNSTVKKFGCLAALILTVPSALLLEAGNLPLSRKGLVLGTTLAGGALLATNHMLQHGLAHQPVSKAKPHTGIQPLPAVDAPAAAAASNLTEPVQLNLTLPEPVAPRNRTAPEGTAAGEPKVESKAASPAQAQTEASRVDALVLAGLKVFPETLCPGELPHVQRAHLAHRDHRSPELRTEEQTDARYRQDIQELATQNAVRNYQERVGTALETLNRSACMVLRKYRDSRKPYLKKCDRLKQGIQNLRLLQTQFLDDEITYNRNVATAFQFAQIQAELGHSGWEEAEGALSYQDRLKVCDAEWDKIETFTHQLVDTMAPILLEMMAGNTTAQAKDHRRWRFQRGW
jgi:hypothetical protein